MTEKKEKNLRRITLLAPADLKREAMAQAIHNGTKLSHVIVDLLTQWLEQQRAAGQPPPKQ